MMRTFYPISNLRFSSTKDEKEKLALGEANPSQMGIVCTVFIPKHRSG